MLVLLNIINIPKYFVKNILCCALIQTTTFIYYLVTYTSHRPIFGFFLAYCWLCVCVCTCTYVHTGGGACVALCLVLTHPAINCVSTAAVCIDQIESSATGPFCFSPLGWAFQTSSFPLIPTKLFIFSLCSSASVSHSLSVSLISRVLCCALYSSLLGDWQTS